MQQLASFNVFKKMKDKLEIIFYKSLGHNKKKLHFYSIFLYVHTIVILHPMMRP